MISVSGRTLEVCCLFVKSVCFTLKRPRSVSCVNFVLCVFKGAPVAVGMSIDVASIDMVSEVNMVSGCYTPPCAPGVQHQHDSQVQMLNPPHHHHLPLCAARMNGAGFPVKRKASLSSPRMQHAEHEGKKKTKKKNSPPAPRSLSLGLLTSGATVESVFQGASSQEASPPPLSLQLSGEL